MFFSNFEACRAIKVGLEIWTVRVFGNVSYWISHLVELDFAWIWITTNKAIVVEEIWDP